MKIEFEKETKLTKITDQSALKAPAQADNTENYKRRNYISNWKARRQQKDSNGRKIPEGYDVTMKKVIEIAEVLKSMTVNEISIAHRLPSRRKTKCLFVKFTRRVAKIEMVKKSPH